MKPKEKKKRKRKGEDNITTGNVLEVQRLCFPCRYQEKKSWYPNKTIGITRKETFPFSSFLRLVDKVQRVSSSSLLSFTLPPPPRLSELACECFLAETAAWTDSRWAKEKAGLPFIQTLLWIAAGG